MRIVIAPDKFRGSLDAAGVADALGAGVLDIDPEADVVAVPLADGGEGSVACALAAGWRPVSATVTGPVGNPVEATFAISPDGSSAMVELATASGIDVLPGGPGNPALDARSATSRGTGELILAALDAGCRRIVVAVGGSACTDGGSGMVRALGLQAYDAGGAPLPDGGGALLDCVRVDALRLDDRLADVEFVLAADVDTPLLGDRGSAAVFGPQKGASPSDVGYLDGALRRWADCLEVALPHTAGVRDRPGAGAAGGVGFGAMAILGAEMQPGASLLLDLTGFDALLTGADLVVTAEGSLDQQSLAGKTPVGVAARAASHGIPCVVVCGRNLLSESEIHENGFRAAYALLDIEPDPAQSMAAPIPLLRRLGAAIVQDHRIEAQSSNSSSSVRSESTPSDSSEPSDSPDSSA